MYSRIMRVIREEGSGSLIKKGVPFIFNQYISMKLPKTEVRYNGVDVKQHRQFKSIVPWGEGQSRPNYESGLVGLIERFVQSGDEVAIIGGGWGVTAVRAAKKVGPSGRVHVYEGSISEVGKINETIQANNVENIVEVEHTIVGSKIALRGEMGDPRHISPDELPVCDVLELDCEGSEVEILEGLNISPRAILVESHGHQNAPSSHVRSILKEKGYTIQSEVVADEGVREKCLKDDIYAITATTG
jgi:hypothetical protein